MGGWCCLLFLLCDDWDQITSARQCCWNSKKTSLLKKDISIANKQNDMYLCVAQWAKIRKKVQFRFASKPKMRKKFQFQMYVWLHLHDYLPQRLKSKFFEIFSSLIVPFGNHTLDFFFQKTLILAFEANSVLSCQNGHFSAF